ncbi:MAG TPA: hypothetical protein VM639_18160 [Dongiaceae bacterium]|nr:hypothetical protein [Dongiaceae bacterium]
MREEAGSIVSQGAVDVAYAAQSPAGAWDGIEHASGAAEPTASARLALIGAPRSGLSVLGLIAGHYGWRDQRQAGPAGMIAADAAALPSGSCLLGAIPHTENAIEALRGFRKILVMRELRSAFVSLLRIERRLQQSPHLAPIWQLPTNQLQMSRFLQQHGPSLFGQFLSVLCWMTEPDVVTLRFEKLQQPDSGMAARLARLLRRDASTSGDRDADAGIPDLTAGADSLLTVLRPASGAAAPVKSAAKAHFRSFWSGEAEALFTAFGGCQLNKALGYDQAYGTDDHAAH